MSTIQETIATLKDYNKWRRGDETITMPDPFEVGLAIGDAVRLLSELEIIKSEFEKIVLIAGQKADSNVELRLRAEKAEAEVAALKRPLLRLTSLWHKLFFLLDITEESDIGNIFRPNYISSCRAVDGERIQKILEEAKQLIKTGVKTEY